MPSRARRLSIEITDPGSARATTVDLEGAAAEAIYEALCELDLTDDNYTPGDEEGHETPSKDWYMADIARRFQRLLGDE